MRGAIHYNPGLREGKLVQHEKNEEGEVLLNGDFSLRWGNKGGVGGGGFLKQGGKIDRRREES